MKPRLHISVYGSGMGHAARMVSLVRRLSFPATFTSWGEGKDYINEEGYRVLEVPAVDIEWSEQGRMAIKKSVTKLPRNLYSLAYQVITERKLMYRTKPSVVISDSRLSAVVAAHSMGLPSILITNQLRIAMPLESSLVQSIIERSVAELLGPFWALADEIIAPDLPPPHTISDKTLLGVKSVKKKVRFIGFLVPKPEAKKADVEKAKRILDVEGKLVYAQISGPRPTRRWFLNLLLAAAPMVKGATVVISVGEPRMNGMKRLKNIRLLYWNKMFDATIALSDLLVSRGGHSTIARGILAGKPMVLVPIAYHGEQTSNSKKAASLGIAKFLNPVELTPKKLAEEISYALEDGGMKNKAVRLSEIASRFDPFGLMKNLIFLYSSIRRAPYAIPQAPSLFRP